MCCCVMFIKDGASHDEGYLLIQVDAGLDALSASMRSGFEQFQKIRTDPNLDNLRKDERFKKMVDKYDEPVFDTGAFK